MLTLPLIVKQQRNTAKMTVSRALALPVRLAAAPEWFWHALVFVKTTDSRISVLQLARPEMMKLKDWYTEETAVSEQLQISHKATARRSSCWF